ncbi:MAG: undecaprenyl-diphosphatase UppP [Candidatus Moranbacteria bacterium RIFCSPHIGHO2_01_FULL_55_24]|nr:MAG: undecaprenyl-diphosphatase UppP [Candidatus Moranbacteria bacterium RIFCSPHIGHO2_01_FULL_55_24]
MNLIDVIILGIVEGLTEFLPISSTGHLILVSRLLDLPHTDFLSTFEIVIQLGAILAVVVLYAKRLLTDRILFQKLVVALLPALGVGALFYPFIKSLFAAEHVVAWTLLVGGILIILLELFQKKKEKHIADLSAVSYRTAFLIGACQALSVIPGVSRAGATILGGLLLGMERRTIVEFSFLLAVPTMLAASTLDLYKNAALFSLDQSFSLAIGFVTSFVVAILAIKFFLRFVGTHTFIPFGVYRILVGLLFLLIIL